LESPPESSRIFGINWNFGRSFQIEAIEHGGTSGELLDQRSNQAQEFLLLWSVTSRDEKGSDLNVGGLSTRGKIGLMPDEHPTDIRIAGEQPPISVGTAVNLSGPNDRELLHAVPLEIGISPINWKGRLGNAPRRVFLPAFRVV
jgi:hypothetical protein